jgi:bifunctional non-homologous end joining protein LigD
MPMLWRQPSIARPFPAGFVAPCLPTTSKQCKGGAQWIHEIKFDGYRIVARRDGERIRLFTRHGYDWAKKYPRIVEALRSLRIHSVIMDGEAVYCGQDGKPDFDKLHSGAHNDNVLLFAFDLLALNGDDFRDKPLEQRKDKLEKLLARSDGIPLAEHIEGDGKTIFEHACRLGLEGIVSKRRDFPYRSGRCKAWIKVKNPVSPAMLRVLDGAW